MTYQCNSCTVSDCNLYKNRKTLCVMRRRPTPFTLPMLTHLLSDPRKVGNTVKVLEKFKFRVYELAEYPFFKLGV